MSRERISHEYLDTLIDKAVKLLGIDPKYRNVGCIEVALDHAEEWITKLEEQKEQ